MWDKVRKYIDGYLNQTYMQSLTVFQTLLQQSKQMQFINEKLPKFKPDNNLTKKSAPQLKNGVNKLSSISVVVLRSIDCNNFTLLLAVENLPVMSLSNYIFVTVVWPQEPDMIARWKEEHSLNLWVTIRQPYKMIRNDSVNFLIVRLENLVLEQGKRWKENSQIVKQKANILFKNNQFLQAFRMYQFALCNNHKIQKSQERAILYSNSAACLYEMRLFSSSVLYCNMAIKSNPQYPKGYSRKINCLLELSQYTFIPPIILKLKSLKNQTYFDYYNEKFTNYMSNDIGIFNWIEIFSNGVYKNNLNAKNLEKFGGFGQYHNNKIEIQKKNQRETYVAREDIYQHELILVNKPMLYLKLSKNSQENFEVILDQVKKNCLLQKSFYETMRLCPPITENISIEDNQSFKDTHPQRNLNSIQNHPFDHLIDKQTLCEAKLTTKLQLSVLMQRYLEKLDHEIGYGLWRDTFYFPFDCDGNCSYVHLKTAFTVFSTRDIKKGEILTIDYLADVEALNRSNTMQTKYRNTCSCKYCCLHDWPQNYNGDVQGLYSLINRMPDLKTKKQMISQLIIKKAKKQEQSEIFDSIFPDIIYKYIQVVDKDPQWQDILTLLRILRGQQNSELQNSLYHCLMKCFSKYLKIANATSKQILEIIK